MGLYCRLDGATFEIRESRDGASILTGVFDAGTAPQARTALLKQMIEAPAAMALLGQMLADLNLIIGEAVTQAGGGVTGALAAQEQFGALYARKEEIERLLARAGVTQGATP